MASQALRPNGAQAPWRLVEEGAREVQTGRLRRRKQSVRRNGSFLTSTGCRQMVEKAGKQPTAVGAAHGRLHVILRVRHHSEHIAALVEDAGDGVDRAVVVPVEV